MTLWGRCYCIMSQMRPREVKNLPRVTQLVRAELGFKSDSHQPAFSRMPLPTQGSCIFHKNSWQCPKTLSSPLRIGWAKGAYFIRCSHGILLRLTCRQCVQLNHSHTVGCVYSFCFFPPWELMCKLRLVTEYEERYMLFAHRLTHLCIHYLISSPWQPW